MMQQLSLCKIELLALSDWTPYKNIIVFNYAKIKTVEQGRSGRSGNMGQNTSLCLGI